MVNERTRLLRAIFRAIKTPQILGAFFKEQSMKVSLQQRFSAKRIALMAVFTALAYAVSFLEFPIFPATPFFKLDFGNVFILLVSFLCGPIEGVLVCIVKESLRILSTSSGGVGELANMLMTVSFILLPSAIYRFKKGLKWVIPALIVACFIGTGVALFANRYINFPLYMGAGASAVFVKVFWYVVAFNLIKTASISILTVLLYKRLSNLLKKWKI